MKYPIKTLSLALLSVLMTACQSFSQSNQTRSQGYESPIPVHVSVMTGARL